MKKKEAALKKLQDKLDDIHCALTSDDVFMEALIEGEATILKTRDRQQKILDLQQKILNTINPWHSSHAIHQSSYVLIGHCILGMIARFDYKLHNSRRSVTEEKEEEVVETDACWGYIEEEDNYTDDTF